MGHIGEFIRLTLVTDGHESRRYTSTGVKISAKTSVAQPLPAVFTNTRGK